MDPTATWPVACINFGWCISTGDTRRPGGGRECWICFASRGEPSIRNPLASQPDKLAQRRASLVRMKPLRAFLSGKAWRLFSQGKFAAAAVLSRCSNRAALPAARPPDATAMARSANAAPLDETDEAEDLLRQALSVRLAACRTMIRAGCGLTRWAARSGPRASRASPTPSGPSSRATSTFATTRVPQPMPARRRSQTRPRTNHHAIRTVERGEPDHGHDEKAGGGPNEKARERPVDAVVYDALGGVSLSHHPRTIAIRTIVILAGLTVARPRRPARHHDRRRLRRLGGPGVHTDPRATRARQRRFSPRLIADDPRFLFIR